ncbi:TIGR02996 domain-containing protein [Pyxidicoccus sp. 3LFB2]
MTGNVLNGLLAGALVAFEQREEETALRLLLDAWRESRSVRIADLVQKQSDRLALGLPSYAFLSRAFSGGLPRPVCFPQVLDWLKSVANEGDAEALERHLRSVQRWPEDPRLIPVLRTIARWPVARNVDVIAALRDLLLHLRAPGTADDIQALLQAMGSWTTYEEALARLQARRDAPPAHPLGVALNTEAVAACDALEAALALRAEAEARRLPLRDMLLARVYAHPDDDAARLVLADHLLEQGDPLGEFIMLQCSPRADEARIRELLAQHGLAWQAPLGPLVRHEATRFERGFPVSVRMRFSRQEWPAPGPAWGTVREVDGGVTLTSRAVSWLAHPHLHAVTFLRRMRSTVAPQLGAYPLPVRRLELVRQDRFEEALFLKLSMLPHLTWLEVTEASSWDVATCFTSPLARRLERFTATSEGTWSLEVTPSEKVPVKAALLNAAHCRALAEAIRAAMGFGRRGLRVRLPSDVPEAGRRLLEEAAEPYARVEWV